MKSEALVKLSVDARFGKYPVFIGSGLDFGKLAAEVASPCKVMIVCDDNVFPLYGQAVLESFLRSGYTAGEYIIKNGEGSKTLAVAERLLGWLAREDMTRGDMLVALGGGVVGDVTGFAAAVYLRGIDFLQIPTTILAAVDSSVGGKTGVDMEAGKNLIGAFHQPAAVFCDTDFFATLPAAIYSDGMAEAIKHGMIADREMLLTLDTLPIGEICRRNIEIKARIVEKDEFDKGERMMLNFGHTVGHAIEKLSGYRIPHGNAVSIGMAAISKASELTGLTEEPVYDVLVSSLGKFGLPAHCVYSAKELAEAALRDKKRFGDTITLVIPKKVGRARLFEIPAMQLESFIEKGLT